MARANQVTCVTPFTLAGAMAPITLAGALAQQNAEALAGMLLTQIVRPGQPVHLRRLHQQRRHAVRRAGVRHARVLEDGDRRRPAGAPLQRAVPQLEHVRRQRRRRPGCVRVDVLAVGRVQGCFNFMMHGAGWMEGGLQASFEKMVIDADLLHMVSADARPDRRRRRLAGVRRDRRGRPGRTLLRHRPHAGPLPLRVLPPADQRLAQLRDMAGGRQPGGRAEGQPARASSSSREYQSHRSTRPREGGAGGVRRPRGSRRRCPR